MHWILVLKYKHFTGKETGAQRGEVTFQKHTPVREELKIETQAITEDHIILEIDK